MANRYVRVYQGPESSNVIGFSASAVPEPESFEAFMGGHGYAAERLRFQDEQHRQVLEAMGGVSMAYYAIEPPLRPEDEPTLVAWCGENVDIAHDSGLLIDNRETSAPLEPFHTEGQRVIARF